MRMFQAICKEKERACLGLKEIAVASLATAIGNAARHNARVHGEPSGTKGIRIQEVHVRLPIGVTEGSPASLRARRIGPYAAYAEKPTAGWHRTYKAMKVFKRR